MDKGNQKDRAICLHRDKRLHVALRYYKPNAVMPLHRHEIDQITFLLAGEFRELVGAKEADLCTSARGLKRSDVYHADQFGPSGALLLSVNLVLDQQLVTDLPGWDWKIGKSVRHMVGALSPVARLLNERNEDRRAEIVWDLVSARIDDQPEPDRRDKARWLSDVRARLIEETDAVSLVDMASASGMHPVHLSRAFKGAFGMPPSVYRARCRLARAISHLVDGAPPANAASIAGFADQSHLSRSIKQEIGVTPRHLQNLLAA